MIGIIIATAALLAALGCWLVAAHQGGGQAEQTLRRICMNDATQAQRLIEYELRRTPNLSRRQAARRAIVAAPARQLVTHARSGLSRP